MDISIITVASLGFTGLCLTLIVRNFNKEMSMIISMAVSLLLFLYALTYIRSLFEFLGVYFKKINGGSLYFSLLIKVLITSYAADFTAQLCRDAGENSMAGKIELAGKAMIFILASPVILSLLELVSRLIIE